jgi:hypothetical protein
MTMRITRGFMVEARIICSKKGCGKQTLALGMLQAPLAPFTTEGVALADAEPLEKGWKASYGLPFCPEHAGGR